MSFLPPFRLRQTLAGDSPADFTDVLHAKAILSGLGLYKPDPALGLHRYPDALLFQGIKALQKQMKLPATGRLEPNSPEAAFLDSAAMQQGSKLDQLLASAGALIGEGNAAPHAGGGKSAAGQNKSHHGGTVTVHGYDRVVDGKVVHVNDYTRAAPNSGGGQDNGNSGEDASGGDTSGEETTGGDTSGGDTSGDSGVADRTWESSGNDYPGLLSDLVYRTPNEGWTLGEGANPNSDFRWREQLMADAGSEAPQPPSDQAPKKPWQGLPNEDMRQGLSRAERSFDKPNDGYGEKNNEGSAKGRYQMRDIALQGAGWKDDKGNWTEKARQEGVRSDPDFIANPDAQEKALTDFMKDNERIMQNLGTFRFVGKTIDGLSGKVPITEGGLAAAAHRQGAPEVDKYLRQRENGESPKNGKEREAHAYIENRLKNFANTPYSRMRGGK